MVSPPGLQYSIRVLPRTILPFALTYLSLIVARSNDLISLRLSSWLILLIALLVQPVVFFVLIFHSRWSDARTAAKNGAVIAPYVQQSPFAIQRELRQMVHGHPCTQQAGILVLTY